MNAAASIHVSPARPEDEAPACGSEHCITCGDDGIPMTVVALDVDRELALCESEDGARHTVEIALVAPVRLADRLLVHAGTAIAHGEPVC